MDITFKLIIERLLNLVEQSVEIFIIACLIATSTLLISSEWRKGKLFFLSAILFGLVSGIVSQNTAFLAPYTFLITTIATISGPITILYLQKKTLFEIVGELKDKLKDSKNKD